jgi:hypothetical protein
MDLQAVAVANSPQRSRELFLRNREFWRRNREFNLLKLKSSPDEVVGTHRTLYPYLPSALHFFDEHAFRVLAAWAYKGPEIESRLTRLNLLKIHLRDAFWAPRAIVHGRVCRRVFELQHVQLQLKQAGVLRALSHQRLAQILLMINDCARIVKK